MSLFVVNRYQGDDAEVEESKDSKNHLSDLLSKIAERKKRKATAEAQTNGEPTQVQSDTPPAKKKQKKKKSNRKKENTEVEDTSQNSSALPTSNKQIQHTEEIQEDDGKSNILKESKDAAQQSGQTTQDFVVLGSESHKKRQIVKRVLPDWLAQPELVSADLNSGPSLEECKTVLDSKLIDILKANGTNKLFPVQASTIHWLLQCNKDRKIGWWPRDACVSAPTGSGKTLAYVLPVVQQLQSRLVRKVRCLVVLPVQELAIQVHKVMVTYTAHTNLRVSLLLGSASFEEEQINLVKRTKSGKFVSRVDIVVATPGRLVDHIKKTDGFSLQSLRFLIIDEADRATDWLQHIPAPHSCAPSLTLANLTSRSNPPAQKLLFSATLSQDPEKLSRLGLFQPKLFTSVIVTDRDGDVNLDKEVGDFVGRYTIPDELTERAVECASEYKPLALSQLLAKGEGAQKTLVFTNSSETAHRLALLLQRISGDGVTVAEMSAQLASKQREDVLQRFAVGDVHVLVSSDALARGVDIPGVKVVVSYDLPKHIKGYIHRAGRTGRAGIQGTAISMLTPGQVGAFTRMLTSARRAVPTVESMDLESAAVSLDYQSHVEKLKEILDKQQAEALQRLKATKRRHKPNSSSKNDSTVL